MKKLYFLEYEKVPIFKLKNILPKKYFELTNGLNLEKKRQRLIKYYLIDYILKKDLSITIEDLNYNEYIYSNSYYKDSLYLNISNKNNILLIAISSNKIGIDLEEIKKRDFNKLLNRFFTKNILNQFLKQQNILEQEKYFYKIWTSSESFLKMEGKTLYYKDIDTHIQFPYIKTYQTNINKKDYVFSISSKDLETHKCEFYYLDRNLKLLKTNKTYKKI